MTDDMPAPGTCTGTANQATGERCGSTEIAGFALHVVRDTVARVLAGNAHRDLYLQPQCAEHLKRADQSNKRLRDEGPSPFLVDIGFVGAGVGTVWIIQPPADPS